MLARFIASDRGFAKARKSAKPSAATEKITSPQTLRAPGQERS